MEKNPFSILSYAIRDFPVDLAVITLLVVAIDVSLLFPLVTGNPLVFAFELLIVMFLPGYVVLAALFPKRNIVASDETDIGTTERRISKVERIGFSFGLSIALVPLIGLVLNFTPWGLRRVPIIVSVSGFVVVLVGVAWVRRLSVSEEERFGPDWRQLKRLGLGRVRQDSRIDTGLNFLLIFGIVLAVSSLAYVFSVPTEGQRYTEFYLLTDDGDELVFEDYPQQFERGEQRPVVLKVENHEYEEAEYTVIVEIQKFVDLNESATSTEELDRLRTPKIDPDDSWTDQYSIEPPFSGERVRLLFLLYRGSPPADPTAENAYRKLQLQLNVTE